MIPQEAIKRIGEYEWEIPKEFRADMRVHARFFASEEMLPQILKDRALLQLVNVATLPGIQGYALAMPDIHEGYGFPIGGVAAMDVEEGVVSPGGIGYDINCGVRLLTSQVSFREVADRIESLANLVFQYVPAGVGKGGKFKLSRKEIKKVLEQGVRWALNNGFATDSDLPYIESRGQLPEADPDAVSSTAIERGSDQLGTMGSGNHFVEIQIVEKIFEHNTANDYGLFEGQVVFMIHTGSRGLGHQVATDYIKLMVANLKKWGITLPDRELACAPISSPEGQQYISAMNAAANFAFTNRQLITHQLRKAWKQVMGSAGGQLRILYDVAHNIAKIETYEVNGKKRRVLVHRKGATRSFGPHHPEIPSQYRSSGQPVLIPGSMGTASYVLAGTETSYVKSWGTTCHGAGRQLSRRKARQSTTASELIRELDKQGIIVKAHSKKGVTEEAPFAYKDVDQVVNVVDKVGIAKKVARLRPWAVVKG